MLIETISLRDFRNIEALAFEPNPRFNIIAGPNGHGKTNLVEAVYVLSALKSFRNLRNELIVRNGSEQATCTAAIDRGGSRRTVEVAFTARHRKVSLNGKPVRKLSDFFGLVNAVAFSPEDINVLRASPEDRRVVLDRMVFNAYPAYASEAQSYESVLRNRNALLKQIAAADQRPNELLAVYDTQLLDHGLRVIQRRRDYLKRLAAPLRAAFQEIFDAQFEPGFDYQLKFTSQSQSTLDDDDALRTAFQAAIQSRRNLDCTRGYSSVGPHRDDVAATLDSLPLRDFASQGQHRAFVLAIKVSEIRLLHQQLGHYPILLLDDVSSELDHTRNEQFFQFLAQTNGQVFITTTDPGYVRLAGPTSTWNIRAGALPHSPV